MYGRGRKKRRSNIPYGTHNLIVKMLIFFWDSDSTESDNIIATDHGLLPYLLTSLAG